MNNVKISFIIATYNGAKFIEEQIKSITQYLPEDAEIVVCDDASEDNTVQVIKGLEDDRIKIFTFKKRVGYQKNFERAVKRTRGQFIFFSDQDDICLPLRISASLDALRFKGCVFGDVEVVDHSLQVLEPSYLKWRGFKKISVLQLVFKPSVIGATIACRKEFLTASIPFPSNIPHDHWLSCLAALKGELAVIKNPVIKYRRHQSVISETGRSSQRKIKVIILERALLIFFLLIKLIFSSKIFYTKSHN